ncbi:MAG TPA: rRNA maturation RNase YbeY [Chitinophagales bacterium]|nr:rRNA maturation RNase YbeY [Chitinophagales bacterium]HNL84284.1 rRNA maturation RNase YbeY [Chitinophagales bacterium]
MAIHFYFDAVKKPAFAKPVQWKKALKRIAEVEAYKIKELTYVFLTDEELLAMNIQYLQHDTYTDIITFDNSSEPKSIEGDIFISLERVQDNARKYKVSYEVELQRVLAHGLLHLCGYKDKTKKDAALMRQKEETAIQLFL